MEVGQKVVAKTHGEMVYGEITKISHMFIHVRDHRGFTWLLKPYEIISAA